MLPRVVRQTEAAECGLACLATVAGHFGLDIDMVSLRRRFPISLRGATLKSLIEIAAALGLGGRAVRCELEELSQLKAPAILHWGLNHFVVLTRVTRAHLRILDPAQGALKVPLKEASREFTGVALELAPSHLPRLAARSRVRAPGARVMAAPLIKPLPTYLDMPVLRLDAIVLEDATLATITEAEAAIERLRSLTIDTARLELRLTAIVSANPDGYRVPVDPRTPHVAASDLYAPRPDGPYRPPSEPAAVWLIEKARVKPLTGVHLLNAAASLLGAPSQWRTREHELFRDSSGLVVRFPGPERVRDGLRQILHLANNRDSELPPLAQAAACGAALLALHPLPDGNGRLARALIQAVLARRDALDRPLVPLGPVLRANARQHAGAMRLFATDADWNPYVSIFARAALRTAHAVLALAKATR